MKKGNVKSIIKRNWNTNRIGSKGVEVRKSISHIPSIVKEDRKKSSISSNSLIWPEKPFISEWKLVSVNRNWIFYSNTSCRNNGLTIYIQWNIKKISFN